MRIAIITLGYNPYRKSGLDVTGERLVRGLLEYDNKVDVFSGGVKKSVENGGNAELKIYRLPIGLTNWIGYSYRISKWVKENHLSARYDIVHFLDIYFSYSYHFPFLASLQHSFRQRIDSIKYHYSKPRPNIYRYIYYSFACTFFERPALRRAQGLLAGSETTRAEYINHYGVPADMIALTRHGIDPSFFRKVRNPNRIRENLGLPEHVPIILFVGFITPRKGLEYLIQALGQIETKSLLLLVGRWISSKYRESVLEIAGPYRDQIIELGYLPDEQMPMYYSLADLYASSSLLEGFGIPIIEAMSCQTPVVVADTGSSAEVTGPGGFLTIPGDIDDLSEKINMLLEDKELRLKMGIQGRAYVEKNFSINNMVRSTLEAYARFRERD